MNDHTPKKQERSYPILDLHDTFLRRTSLNNTNLENANLSGADFSFADFRGANMKNTNLAGTILIGADLRGVLNLTTKQIAEAVIDEKTILPIEIVKVT